MTSKIIVLIGFQASTKSTFADHVLQTVPNVVILSKDAEKNKSSDYLIQLAEKHITDGKVVIIDNTNLTIASRKPYIDLGKRLKVKVHANYFKSSIEDCQIRHLKRMYDLFGYIPQTGKLLDGMKDPHAFGPSPLFVARKSLEEPTRAEGFSTVIVRPIDSPTWDPTIYCNKALFLDVDGTIRATEHLPNKYPTSVEQVELLHPAEKMRLMLESYREKGYQLIGVSNQSGIAKGTITSEQADEIFEKTRSLLGYTKEDFPILYCPHPSMPITCFCRKPQSGMVMECIMKLKLDPTQSIMVGDRKTDQTMADRLKIRYYDVNAFWK